MSGIKRNGMPKPGNNPTSRSVEVNGLLFVSGCVPIDADGKEVYGSIVDQATVALDHLVRRLAEAGYTTTDVVRVGVWLDDPRDAKAFNEVYKKYFTAEHAPARVAIQGTMLTDCKVEIDAIAWQPR